MAAAQDGKLVIMYLDGTPFIAKQVTSNYIEFYGDKEDNVLYITGIDNTWDGLTKKGVSYFPYESSGDGDLHTFVELGGENAYKWAASQELRNYLQLYTKSEIQTLAQNKWVAQSEDGVTYEVVFAADNNQDCIMDYDLITTGCSFVIIPSMTSTSINTMLVTNDIVPLRLRGTGDTNTAVVPSKANWLVANKPIRVTFDGTYWVADLMDDIPTGMTYTEGELPTKPAIPVADGEEIPYTWEEINAITLAGKAQEYFSLGATKLVNLSTAVLGANAATMMVIGFNQDGENTVTFQTKGVLPTYTTFGSSAAWIGSTARTQCQNFYNACNAKNFIKTVKKGTSAYNSSRNGVVTYTDETVWLPSEREMGLDAYSSLSAANSTTSKAECTQGYNAAYSYYTSNTTRVKYNMKADGTLTTNTSYYWERSYASSGYCTMVSNNGSASYESASSGRGIAPIFAIGNSNAESSSGKITQDGEDITNKIASTLGGTKVEVGSYIGTGTYGASNPNKLTFSFEPKVVFFWERLPSASSSNILQFGSDMDYWLYNSGIMGPVTSTFNYNTFTTLTDKTLTWYSPRNAIAQNNTSEYEYHYIAIG